MKAIVLHSPWDMRLDELKMPHAGPGEAVCKVICAGVCGTDYSIFSGAFSAIKSGRVKFPLRLGHEWVGEVVEVGAGVTSFSVGDRVIGDTAVSCGQCISCLTGKYQQCCSLRSVGTVNAYDGVMGEYVVFPVRHLFHVSKTISNHQAALVEPAANAYYAIKQAGVRAGSSVLITGTGPIGMAAVAIAKAYGASTIISVGRSPFKLEKCMELGATHAINTKDTDPVAEVLRITEGKGVDVSIEISGATQLLQCCISCTCTGGIVSIVALYDQEMTIAPDELLFKNLTIQSVPGGVGVSHEVLHLMETGMIDLETLVTQICSLEELPSVFADYQKNRSQTVKIMVHI